MLLGAGLFDVSRYADINPDVVCGCVDPVCSRFANGWHEDLNPDFLFDDGLCQKSNPYAPGTEIKHLPHSPSILSERDSLQMVPEGIGCERLAESGEGSAGHCNL